MNGYPLLLAVATAALSVPALADGPTISSGIDARASNSSEDNSDAELHGLFLNMRQVWQDEEGDRWIAVGQIDVNHNFKEVEPYQVYLQYKGPLGKWNVRAGHFLLPFGLLQTYDTERLLLTGLEEASLGIRHDTGAEFFGRFGDWDYAIAVTDGLGVTSLTDSRANPVVSGRIAYVQDDWQLGLSGLVGDVVFDEPRDFGWDDAEMRRVGLDFTRSWGPLILRAEALAGTENGEGVWGGVMLADYALTERLELNTRAAFWHGGDDQGHVAAGLTYRLAQGLFLRVADQVELSEGRNNIIGQVYYEIAKF